MNAMASKGPQIGDRAPDFTLEGTGGTFTLSDHAGQRVILLFYPGDFTPVCTRQFCSYGERAEEIDDLGATLVGISAQDLDSHEQFVAKAGGGLVSPPGGWTGVGGPASNAPMSQAVPLGRPWPRWSVAGQPAPADG